MCMIAAKLLTPLDSGKIARERLFRLLDGESGKKLTVVVAGAGCGKTSLVAGYVRARKLSHIWLQLDEGDRDPAIFCRYLLRGLRSVCGYEPPGAGPAPGAVVTALQEFSGSLVVVLEDYHLVDKSIELNRFVNRLIDYLPPNIRVMVTSRRRPPLMLARRRARGEVAEISAGQLKFTLEEALEFFDGTGISREEIEKLWEINEGWAAGLSLSRYHLSKSAGGSIYEFKKYTDEYLAEEILDRLPPASREDLEKLSFLEYMELDVCEELLEKKGIFQLLNRLCESGMFVNKLDESSFSYHRLLKDFLFRRLRERAGAPGIRALHERIGYIYAARGDAMRAAAHFWKSGNTGELQRQVVSAGQALLQQGGYDTLYGWIKRLPRPAVKKSPRLLYYLGLCESALGYKEKAAKLLKEAEFLFERGRDYLSAAEAALALASLANSGGDGAGGVENARRAMNYLRARTDGEEKPALLGEIYAELSRGYLLEEEWEKASRCSEKAMEIFRREDMAPFYAVYNSDYLFFIYHPQVDLERAETAFQAAHDMWRSRGNSFEALNSLVNLAMIHRITGNTSLRKKKRRSV